jgi:hypothetical protein
MSTKPLTPASKWWGRPMAPADPAPLPRPCSWCGRELALVRRGLRESRAFCSIKHRDNFYALARRVGGEVLDQTAAPASAYLENSAGLSGEGEPADE